MSLRRLAPAKINLALHVTGQRDDGYHLLDSLVCFANIGDLLTFEPAEDLTLELRGPEAKALEGDNLVLRAAESFAKGQGAKITLDKRLPVAAGIGGGSADAAATLQGLAALWGQDLPEPAAVLALGADVPACLSGQVSRMQGIGEVLTPLAELPPLFAVLVNPRIPLSTPEMFKALEERNNAPLPATIPTFASAKALAQWLADQRNDLEEVAVDMAPEIDEVLEMIDESEGCLLARMSGSGATCFGLFATEVEADEAAAVIRMLRFDWWVKSVRLGAGRDFATV